MKKTLWIIGGILTASTAIYLIFNKNVKGKSKTNSQTKNTKEDFS